MWNDQQDTVETVEDAIRQAERLGWSLSLEQFDGDEEAFWWAWIKGCESIERQSDHVFGWD